jgi:hypothetical protein
MPTHDEIEDYREDKGRKEYDGVAAGHQPETPELVPLTHSKRHHREDGRHGRGGNVDGMAGENQNHEQ